MELTITKTDAIMINFERDCYVTLTLDEALHLASLLKDTTSELIKTLEKSNET